MMYDFIAVGIIVVCFGAIVFIVWKKFPVIAAINVGVLEKHKQEKRKKDLIEGRLKRKLSAFRFSTLFKKEKEGKDQPSPLQNFYKSIKNLEQRYRQKIQEIEPQGENEVEKKRVVLLQEAQQHLEREQLKEAESKYIEAISLDHKFREAYSGLAEVYLRMKDFIHAKEVYQYLLRMKDTDDAVYGGLGKIATQQGDLKEAEQDYLKSISLNSEVASYHVALGEVYRAMGNQRRALGCFREAIKLEPNNPRHLDLVIEAALQVADKQVASEYYAKLKEVNPDNEKLPELEERIKELSSRPK